MRMHSSPAGRRTGALTLLSALVFTGVGPAAAHPPAPIEYVALGDSYASGFGAGPYVQPEVDPYGAACLQSPLGLPGLLDAKEKIKLVGNPTCAGALAATVPGGAVDVPEQIGMLQQARLLDEDTDLVTVSAGGNDAGFGDFSKECVGTPEAACARFIAGKIRSLPAVGRSLDILYRQIDAAAPDATVVVTGYPHLFSPEFGATFPISSSMQRLFNAATDILNLHIRKSAKANGFVYVDTVKAFDGHGIGSTDPWINLGVEGEPGDLHPNAEGYEFGYLAAVQDKIDLKRPGKVGRN